MVRLSELVDRIGGSWEPCGGGDPDVREVELDSRRAAAHGLFAALPGLRCDGAQYASQAVERGAVAVLAPRRLELGPVPVWIHPEARRAVGEAAAMVHGSPSESMQVMAVTGTNGKTTVAWIAGQLLEHLGRKPAVIGTVSYRVAGEAPCAARTTTPEATELQRLLARHRDAGGDSACVEASSHALQQERLAGTAVDIAVFTNLSRDHLDYHQNMEQYAAAKARLFTSLSPDGTAIVNADDPAGAAMEQAARERGSRVVTYGSRSRADLSASDVRVGPRGLFLTIHGMGISSAGSFLPLMGRHNVENALAAFAAVLAMGASPSALVEGLATVSPAPGRLEPVPTPGRDCLVLVDYAHTDAALCSVLSTLREFIEERGPGGRLLCVFGCGGDRDQGKRGPMGRHANLLADVVVVTSDNPREEDPDEIIRQILVGMEPRRAEVHVESDRESAIALAADLAGPDDVILIAGKGHESVQKLAGGVTRPCDDRAIAAEAFA